MLSGLDVRIAGLWHDGQRYCVACAKRKLGGMPVERLMVGLGIGEAGHGWSIYYGWEADEHATDNGYDCDGYPGCDHDEHGFCEEAAVCLCVGCDTRLDAREMVKA